MSEFKSSVRMANVKVSLLEKVDSPLTLMPHIKDSYNVLQIAIESEYDSNLNALYHKLANYSNAIIYVHEGVVDEFTVHFMSGTLILKKPIIIVGHNVKSNKMLDFFLGSSIVFLIDYTTPERVASEIREILVDQFMGSNLDEFLENSRR